MIFSPFLRTFILMSHRTLHPRVASVTTFAPNLPDARLRPLGANQSRKLLQQYSSVAVYAQKNPIWRHSAHTRHAQQRLPSICLKQRPSCFFFNDRRRQKRPPCPSGRRLTYSVLDWDTSIRCLQASVSRSTLLDPADSETPIGLTAPLVRVRIPPVHPLLSFSYTKALPKVSGAHLRHTLRAASSGTCEVPFVTWFMERCRTAFYIIFSIRVLHCRALAPYSFVEKSAPHESNIWCARPPEQVIIGATSDGGLPGENLPRVLAFGTSSPR